MTASSLALLGGPPVSKEAWPVWPQSSSELVAALRRVADSSVWAISGRSNGLRLQAAQFCEEFAAEVGRCWCVETDHGTSALVASLEALDIGPGDEVIVPALTWVACATAVLQVGACPVLADVDRSSLCISATTAAEVITHRTRCIMVVHLACTAADMEPLVKLADSHGITILEDCAQAHGGRWRDGSAVGSHGVLAAYSMQNGKALTCGEGGAVVGDDARLQRLVESARADTRVVRSGVPTRGDMYLDESGRLCGSNYCLSEFSSAVLRSNLTRLNEQCVVRHDNADYLDGCFSEIDVRVIRMNPELEVRPVYEYGIFVGEALENEVSIELAREALSAELGVPVYEIDPPIDESRLFLPESKRRFTQIYGQRRIQNTSNTVASHAHRTLAMVHHSVLLAPRARMNEIVEAVEKVIRHRKELYSDYNAHRAAAGIS